MAAVFGTQQRQQRSEWLCLLAATLHLLAPLCPACPAWNPKAKADAMGRVTAESSHGQTHYEYDLAGNRVKATYSTGRVVETSYDGLNRPEAIVDGDRLTRYGYDKAGRAVILVAANGQTSSNTYDALGRLTDRVLYKTPAMDPAQRLAQFKWQHDLLGNVTQQEEIWPGETARSGDFLRTTMGYDANNRLISESIVTYYETYDEGQITTYTYDDANNRTSKSVNGGAEPGHWDYTYNAANQLTAWEHLDYPNGSVLRSATLTYDDAGNRTSQAVTQISGSYNPTYNPQPAVSGLTQYTWDAQDRLASVTLPDGSEHHYAYDYRTRRISTGVRTPSSANETKTSIVFSGGLSVAEWEQESGTGLQPVLSAPPTVEYTRGPDMGGGVGGLLYTSRSESASASVSSSRTLRYNLSNGRGDIVAQSDSYASLTWTASYEAYGKRTKETGENKDKQRGNSKDEDPTGLLNEGFRYRDIETGVWLSRDPAGFVDGPNLYAYVMQNPWTKFDPDGQFWSALITVGFAAYDTYQYATGQTSGAEYGKAMALNGAALLADVATAGNGGGLAVRAANATIKVAKAVDKANNIVETAQAAVETTETIVAAVQEGDGRGLMRTVGGALLEAATDKAMGKKGRGADAPKQRAEGSYGELRKAGEKDAHHVIQHAAMEEIPGYHRDAAPAVQLDGPSTLDGSEHKAATDSQKRPGGGTYGAERKIGYRALREAGIDKTAARGHIERADKYFESLGVDKSTPTRTVGNRRRR